MKKFALLLFLLINFISCQRFPNTPECKDIKSKSECENVCSCYWNVNESINRTECVDESNEKKNESQHCKDSKIVIITMTIIFTGIPLSVCLCSLFYFIDKFFGLNLFARFFICLFCIQENKFRLFKKTSDGYQEF